MEVQHLTRAVTINKPGSDFHGMKGEVIRTEEKLGIKEVYMPRQKMNPATSTRETKWGSYVAEWRGGSWFFTINEVEE